MTRVKKEEEPQPLGFSATRLGMEKAIEKQVRYGIPHHQSGGSHAEDH